MNAERLLAHYEKIADAPDAIVRLRRFILDLAVRGKLVAQDPNDEPAFELLKRIGDDKRSRSLSSRDRKTGQIAPLAGNQPAYSIAPSWVWASFGDITISRDGERIPVSREERSGRAKVYDYYGASGVIDKIDGYLFDKPLLLIGEDGANLINRSTPIAFMARGNYWVNNHAHVIDGFSEQFLQYLELFINAIDLKPYVTGAAQPKMNQAKMNSIPVAVPPLAEQHRIVSKVDELMALCDRLETAQACRETASDRLMSASLARLNAPNPETFRADTCFALRALPALTTRPDQIKALRQTILNLAVCGKLVPQDVDDEQSSLNAKDCKDLPAEIPAGWRYVRLANLLSEDTRNGYSRKPDDAHNGVPILRISAGTARNDGIVAEEEHKLISGIDQEGRLQYGLKPGDLLACRFNGNKAFVGRLTIFKDYLALQPIYPDKLIRVRVSPGLAIPEFLRIASESSLVRADVEAACATTVGNWGISASKLKEVRFPLPPLAEQHRIVSKVDELMALCDKLEANLTSVRATRRRLLDALLAEALAPAADRELEAAE